MKTDRFLHEIRLLLADIAYIWQTTAKKKKIKKKINIMCGKHAEAHEESSVSLIFKSHVSTFPRCLTEGSKRSFSGWIKVNK